MQSINKTGLIVGVIVCIAVLALFYVKIHYAPVPQPVKGLPVQLLTPSSGDIGTALRGPSSATPYPGRATALPYPTTYSITVPASPTKQVYPTALVYPTLTSTPFPTATNTPLPNPTKAPTAAPSTDPSIINYIQGGFSPVSTTVQVGTWVTFRNYTTGAMKIAGNAGTLATYPNFGEQVAVGQYGFYQFRFTISGTFGYFDQNNPSFSGTVVVAK